MDTQQTVVVTGAASGMGRAVVDRLLGTGDRVLGLDRAVDTIDALADQLGPAFAPLAVDVVDRAALDMGLHPALTGESLRAVVNAAGVHPPTTLADVTRERHDLNSASTCTAR